MPRFILSAHKVQREVTDGVPFITIRYSLRGDDPFPRREVEARNTAEAMAALEAYKAEAAGTGLMLGCSIMLAPGQRAPAGFRQARTTTSQNVVNGDKAVSA